VSRPGGLPLLQSCAPGRSSAARPASVSSLRLLTRHCFLWIPATWCPMVIAGGRSTREPPSPPSTRGCTAPGHGTRMTSGNSPLNTAASRSRTSISRHAGVEPGRTVYATTSSLWMPGRSCMAVTRAATTWGSVALSLQK
jgi:hypothetical protein